MTILGKNTIGGTVDAMTAGTKRFSKFVAPNNSGVTSISAYVNRTTSGGGYAVSAGIYADNAGVPGALIANSVIQLSTNITRNAPGWYTASYSTAPTIVGGTTYWVGVSTANAINTYSDAGTTNQQATNAQTYSATSMTDPFGSGITYAAKAMSVYVDLADPITIPGAPTASTGGVTTTSTTWNWTAPTSGSAPANYEYEIANDAGFTSIKKTEIVPSATTSTQDTTALTGTQYYFRVRAINSAGTGAWSNVVTQTTNSTSLYTITTWAAESVTKTIETPTNSNGDLMMLVISLRQLESVVTPTGFTLVGGAAISGTDNVLYVFTRIADNEPTSYSISPNAMAISGVALCTAWSGVSTLRFHNSKEEVPPSGYTTTITATGTANSGDVGIAIFTQNDEAGESVSPYWSFLSPYTVRATGEGGSNVTLGIAHHTFTASAVNPSATADQETSGLVENVISMLLVYGPSGGGTSATYTYQLVMMIG